MADSFPTIEELKKLRVVDLKERLSALGLTSGGLKADLVARLDEYYVDSVQQTAAIPAMPEPQLIPPVPVQDPQMLHQQQIMEQQRLMEQQMMEAQAQAQVQAEAQQRQEQDRMMQEQQRQIEEQRQREHQQVHMMEQMLMQQQQQEQQRLMEHQQMIQQQQQQQEQEHIRQQQMMEQQMIQEKQRQEQERMMQDQQRIAEQQRQEAAQREVERQHAERQREMEAQQHLSQEQEQRNEAEHIRLAQHEHIRLAQQQAAMLENEKEETMQQQALLQTQLLAAEEQHKEQEKEALGMQQQVLLAKERHEKEIMASAIVQQQQMMEAERQQAVLAQQAIEAERQAGIIRQQKEAELLHHQQMVFLERQKEEELIKQRQEEQRRMLEEQAKIPPPGLFNAPVAVVSRPPVMQQPPIQAPPMRSQAAPPTNEAPTPLMSIEMSQPPMLNDSDEDQMKLPSALEKVLAFKDFRAQEIQQDLENVTFEGGENETPEDSGIDQHFGDDEEHQQKLKGKEKEKESKNKKRKKKKKRSKINKQNQIEELTEYPPQESETDVEIEYVEEELKLDRSDPNYHQFARIFEAFKLSDPEKKKDASKDLLSDSKNEKPQEEITKGKHLLDLDEEEKSAKEADEKPKVSKKRLKKLSRLSVAELKQLVSRPDVVEMHDVTAQDPKLLVNLKATRNSVPVPRHWCFKRKYLQGKRGIEKAPFDLPHFIKATGIMEMREALAEKEDQKTLKSKMREKIRPKMGKIDIDYQKLHDAFFRFQTKPKLTMHGELYYEGKEFETKLKEKKPGNLSDDLKTALGMPVGSTAEKFPPPWLIAMQRYGPPPSYPNLKIPGLNAAIPDGCTFGYHAGGWGKPPVDENGKPLYGDVFGTLGGEFQTPAKEDEIDKTLWGELESESESESESEEESDEEKEEADKSGLVTPGDAGLVTPSGMTSMPAGMETPDMIELRKKSIEDQMEGGDTPSLYTVVPEKKTTVGGALMGSAHVYDMPSAAAKKTSEKSKNEGVEVVLNPDELDLDTAAMQAKYEQRLKESQLEKEDLSDMVAEHAAKQKKRKKQQQDSGKSKKYKEFKF